MLFQTLLNQEEVEEEHNNMAQASQAARAPMTELQSLQQEVQKSNFAAESRTKGGEGSFGLYLGYCVDTLDVYKQNRIRFFCPFMHQPRTVVSSLPFAMPISPMGGIDDSGSNWIPPAGSTVALLFEGGDRLSPFYIGTTWTRLNGNPIGGVGQQGGFYGVPMQEYFNLYQGRRGGYLCGPNNGTQLLPPWNTESYNGFDITSIEDINKNPFLLESMTFPNIYGFKTPEKHMIKMVDGDAKCNRKWKRIEIMSGCGNWMIMKDDHLHYCGQWAHPVCGARSGDTSCQIGSPNPPPQTVIGADGQIQAIAPVFTTYDIQNTPNPSLIDAAYNDLENNPNKLENPQCNGRILGGPAGNQTGSSQVGANPFFKQQSECRPYKGPQTPQNNSCNLPQSGIQFLSISGHTFVMDDSVEVPQGGMEWERSTKPFDFGCTNKYMGRSYWKSATGHSITLNDIEKLGANNQVRGQNNGIQMLTALGNQILMSDESVGPNCPSLAAEQQGISMVSTSGHTLVFSDNQNDRNIPCRKEIGSAQPQPNAKNAYVLMRSGYGFAIRMYDGTNQTEATDDKFLEIFAPQKGNIRGGTFILMRERKEQNGYLQLRAGGDYRLETYGSAVEIIGFENEEKSAGSKITLIKGNSIEITKEIKYTKNKSALSVSDTRSLILAGKDYDSEPTEEQKKAEEALKAAGLPVPPREKVPNVCPVLVFDAKRGTIVFSDRLFASASPTATAASIFNMAPLRPTKTDTIQELKNQINKG